MGDVCNNNCVFCLNPTRKDRKELTTREIRDRLRDCRDRINEVAFTGGEPTIRNDILELLFCADQLGYSLVQLQTNGRMFAYKDFCERISRFKKAHYFITLNAHTAELHDSLIRCKGGFSQTVKGIRNLRSSNAQIITNTVVVKQNYEFLPEIADFIISLGVSNLQFTFVEPQGNALANFHSVVPRMERVVPYLLKALDKAKKKGIVIKTSGIPFCLMKDHEEHIVELYFRPKGLEETGMRFGDSGYLTGFHNRTKGAECRRCRYDPVCIGVWKGYAERMGFDEFVPVRGKPVNDFGYILKRDIRPVIQENV